MKKMPKLFFVKFKDHSVAHTTKAGVFPDDLKELPIPIPIVSICGWVLKESKDAIWLYSELCQFPKDLPSFMVPDAEGFKHFWCILKSNIIEMKEIKLDMLPKEKST